MKILIVVLVSLMCFACREVDSSSSTDNITSNVTADIWNSPLDSLVIGSEITPDSVISDYFEQTLSDQQVGVRAKVIILLEDDLDGDQHQKFIVELENGLTLLVAHNISVGTRVDDLIVNSLIYLFGVYEWNDEGGVIHWTHYDLSGEHENGFIIYQGVKYQ